MLARRLAALILTVSLALFTACGSQPSDKGLTGDASTSASTTAPAISRSFGRLPLYFVENRGQTDPRVAYYVPGRDQTLYFAQDGLTFAFTSPIASIGHEPSLSKPAHGVQPSIDGPLGLTPPALQRWAVKLDFVGADPNVRPQGLRQTKAVFSYFKGKPSHWQAGLPSFAQLRYPDLWPGIDLVYSGQINELKYEFVVQPGADPAQIQLAYRGASDVRLTPDGQLEVTTPLGGFRDAAPVAYQVKDGQRAAVEMSYRLNPSIAAGDTTSYGYGFHLGTYDPSLPLVLDPVVVVYAGYIGGASGDYGRGIAVDGAGNAYVTGYTTSDQTNFPVTVGPDLAFNGGSNEGDAFVAKVNAAGTALIYAGYIGGSGEDLGTGIALDTAGNAYITGRTDSDQSTFPITGGPDSTSNGFSDAFVAKVNAAGTALVYAGYIGGAGSDGGSGIAVHGAGNAYLTGFATSDQTAFPVNGGPDLSDNGDGDAFVAKVNAAGTALSYAGYIGGSGAPFGDNGFGITVDGAGNAYVTGWTGSGQNSFPVMGGPDLTYNGGLNDAFVAKVNSAGTALVYAGYIGGAGFDTGYGIAVDGSGNVYVTGVTGSLEASFPVTVGPDLTYNGDSNCCGYGDAFVAKVNAAGTALVYAGYIGGSGDDFGYAIAVGGAGNAYVMGHTSSDQTTFPVTSGPDLTFNGGTYDAFLTKVDVAGTALVYASYIGGDGWDEGSGVALDSAGNAYVTGYSVSNQSTFPVTHGPDLTYNGGGDAFVAKVAITFVPTAFLYLPLVQR